MTAPRILGKNQVLDLGPFVLVPSTLNPQPLRRTVQPRTLKRGRQGCRETRQNREGGRRYPAARARVTVSKCWSTPREIRQNPKLLVGEGPVASVRAALLELFSLKDVTLAGNALKDENKESENPHEIIESSRVVTGSCHVDTRAKWSSSNGHEPLSTEFPRDLHLYKFQRWPIPRDGSQREPDR